MRIICLIVGILNVLLVQSQSDTIVVHDYTKVMIRSEGVNDVLPVTSLSEIKQAGFFLNEIPNGKIRICNNHPTSIWINGRLIETFLNCQIFDPNDWVEEGKSDTLFISIYAQENLANLACDLIVFDDLQVIKDDPKVLRDMRSEYEEFSITTIFILIFLTAFYIVGNPSRSTYIAQRTFSVKSSSYEFVNVNVLSGASVQLAILISVIVSFLGIHFSQALGLGIIENDSTFWQIILSWLSLALLILSFLIAKWVIVITVSKLFRFRGMPNFQLFDFLNYSLLISLLILVTVIIDFIVNPLKLTWFGDGFISVFPIALISFIVWFSLKFLNNSTRKKLLIFSYLCATEIIPAILIFGWFFK